MDFASNLSGNIIFNIMNFSQRMGITPIKAEIQIKSMDNDLRNSLWNVLKILVFDIISSELQSKGVDAIRFSKFHMFFIKMWMNFFKYSLDTLSWDYPNIYRSINKYFFECEWYRVYDFIEFVVTPDSPMDKELFKKTCNSMLERELSGYRFCENLITPITNENELKEIEKAIENAQKTKLSGVNKHLISALAKLSDRQSPDYRNSIKEAISSVESISIIISGDAKATLGQALKVIKDKVGLHPSLEKGFSAIYGYTSSESGIRHAIFDESDIYFEDAKYMLVSCSAFINYLIMKSQKVGIKLN